MPYKKLSIPLHYVFVSLAYARCYTLKTRTKLMVWRIIDH